MLTEIAALSLVSPKDSVLRSPTKEVTDIASEVLPHVDAMRELMAQKNGIGLAAPQVGIGFRFFVSGLPGYKVVINPKIVSTYGGRTSKPEGCLTWPGRTTYVARHTGIRVEWTDRHGKTRTENLSDFSARVFQHETDYLNGICIFA